MMKFKTVFSGMLLLGLFASEQALLRADVVPSGVFQDHMVLQREKKVPVWGKADPGESVTVSFAGASKTVVAGPDGKWMIELPAMKASAQGQEMKIDGKNKLTLKDILVGEVWIASGQSNMGFLIPEGLNAAQELANANHPQIRFLPVKCVWAKEPSEQFTGTWQVSDPENAKNFSAIAYFFAREIQQRVNVPVGIIQSAWGGTPAEAWTPIRDMEARPQLYSKYMSNYNKFKNLDNDTLAKMRAEAEKTQRQKDPGNEGEKKAWHSPSFDDSAWEEMVLPNFLETHYGDQWDGIFWFRREVEIPKEYAGQELVFHLGAVDDIDTTYFNGERIGSTGFEVPEWWDYQRVYRIPAKLVKEGKNLIAVRVVDERYAGGLVGPKIFIETPDGKKIDLAGKWKTRDEVKMKPLPGPDFAYIPHIPSYLWNGMIHPFIPFAIRGVIWHQGENNSGDPLTYRTLFKDMIQAWRREFKQGDFPFYYVQLSNYMKRSKDATQSALGWPGLREAQTMALSLPATGMAVTIDVGDANDIHPKNKQEHARRLALPALVKTYGFKDLAYHGPMFHAVKFDGAKALVTFDSGSFAPQNALKVNGEKLLGFSICGEDGVFVWADAKIIAPNIVEVSSPKITKATAVRYAWANNPECNLYNAEGLPANPFRTDDFSK